MSRQMPNSIEAEQALLGSMLMYERSVKTAMEAGATIDLFYIQSHRRIFSAMQNLYDDNKPVDITSVANKLKDLGQLEGVGSMNYLIELSDGAVTSSNTKHYVEILENKTYLRNLIETAEKIVNESFDESEEVGYVLDNAEKQILNVTRTRRTSEFRNSSEVVTSVMDNIYKMRNQKGTLTGIKTGFTDLDNNTKGLQRGDLIVLAARPGVGKTAFALNVALNAAQYHNDSAVAIFSLEMPAEQLMQRMLASKSEVNSYNIRDGRFTNDEMNRVVEAAAELKAVKLFIDDTPGVKMSEVFSKCRKLESEHGLALIVIDYIQLINGSGKSQDRQQEVSEITRQLKALARELKVPVIALSQLSRRVEERQEKRPMLSDLRESGAIEQDADIVMFLYREDYYDKLNDKEERKDNVIVELIIAKHRNGSLANIDLAMQLPISSFKNVAKNM